MSAKDEKAWMLIGLVVTIFVAILVAGATLKGGRKPEPNNCIGRPEYSTVIVLDHSEAISAQTLNAIVERSLKHIFERVKVNEKVTIYSVTEDSKKSLIPLVSVCRPPDDGNRAYENVQMIKKRFQTNFEKPIRAALSSPVTGSKESPIAQAITDITLSDNLRGKANSLLIFSDMMEYTPRFSLYECRNQNEVIKRYSQAVSGTKVRPTFKNTGVEIHIIPRAGMKPEVVKCRDAFWPWFFGDNEGGDHSALVVDYLPGN